MVCLKLVGQMRLCWGAGVSAEIQRTWEKSFGHVAFGISLPWPGIEPRPWHWKPRILTIRPPGISSCEVLRKYLTHSVRTQKSSNTHEGSWEDAVSPSHLFSGCVAFADFFILTSINPNIDLALPSFSSSLKNIFDSGMYMVGFPGGPVVKNLPCNAGDAGLIPG